MPQGDEKREPEEDLIPVYSPSLNNGAGGFFAVVSSDGTLYRGYRAVSAVWRADGEYHVEFNASVGRGACVVTVSCPEPLRPCEPPGYFASATPIEGEPRKVMVRTWKPGPGRGATAVDAGFHLVVMVA